MRLGQNGMRSGCSARFSGHADKVPPVDRQHPPHYVIAVELGKPVVFLSGWAGRVSASQGTSIGSGQGIAEQANAGL